MVAFNVCSNPLAAVIGYSLTGTAMLFAVELGMANGEL